MTTSGAFSWTPTETQGPGIYTFDVIVSDGSLTDSQTIRITVNEVNAAPTSANKTVTTDHDTQFTFATADFGFSDLTDSPANSLATVKIDTLPSAGTLALDGTAVVAGQEVTAADLGSGKLVFSPAAGAAWLESWPR